MNADVTVKALREMLPPQVDYAKLVCAEGFAHGQHYVWEDPESYIIADAADLIESLQAQLAASQARERAAVEQLRLYAGCHVCNRREGTGCALGGCYHAMADGVDRFEWVGPQEAGEGKQWLVTAK